jgi:hypothetical protein
MFVSRRTPWPVAMARMSAPPGGGGRSRSPDRGRVPVDDVPPSSEEVPLDERMSFFESSYELTAGLEVRESTWAEALDMCPDSGWPPLAPLPLPPRTRSSKQR